VWEGSVGEYCTNHVTNLNAALQLDAAACTAVANDLIVGIKLDLDTGVWVNEFARKRPISSGRVIQSHQMISISGHSKVWIFFVLSDRDAGELGLEDVSRSTQLEHVHGPINSVGICYTDIGQPSTASACPFFCLFDASSLLKICGYRSRVVLDMS
jgi:hypothetical protein